MKVNINIIDNLDDQISYSPNGIMTTTETTRFASLHTPQYTPLITFIIFCIIVMTFLLYKRYTSLTDSPSIFILSLLSFYILMSCSLLMCIGNISTSFGWSLTAIYVLLIILFVYSNTTPEVLIYPEIS
jgi:hypothetical protein